MRAVAACTLCCLGRLCSVHLNCMNDYRAEDWYISTHCSDEPINRRVHGRPRTRSVVVSGLTLAWALHM